MKTKTIALLGVALLVLIGITVLIIPNTKTETKIPTRTIALSDGSLTLTKTNFDFGTIKMDDGTVSTTYTITNNSNAPVSIGKVYTSCACTTAYLTDAQDKKYGRFGMPGHSGMLGSADVTVQPGTSVVVEGDFNPAYHGPSGVGLSERTIYIETNSRTTPKIEASFRATVIR